MTWDEPVELRLPPWEELSPKAEDSATTPAKTAPPSPPKRTPREGGGWRRRAAARKQQEEPRVRRMSQAEVAREMRKEIALRSEVNA